RPRARGGAHGRDRPQDRPHHEVRDEVLRRRGEDHRSRPLERRSERGPAMTTRRAATAAPPPAPSPRPSDGPGGLPAGASVAPETQTRAPAEWLDRLLAASNDLSPDAGPAEVARRMLEAVHPSLPGVALGVSAPDGAGRTIAV